MLWRKRVARVDGGRMEGFGRTGVGVMAKVRWAAVVRATSGVRRARRRGRICMVRVVVVPWW